MEMKAWLVQDKWDCYGAEIVFAETRGKARALALATDCCSETDFLDVDVRRQPNADKYYKIYDMLIEEIKAELPDVKIIILEPFVLKVEGTETETYWDRFDPEVREHAEMAKKIAEKHSLAFVPLQVGFDELCKYAPAEYWLIDGVHPTPMGHEFIKNEWLKAFNNI